MFPLTIIIISGTTWLLTSNWSEWFELLFEKYLKKINAFLALAKGGEEIDM